MSRHAPGVEPVEQSVTDALLSRPADENGLSETHHRLLEVMRHHESINAEPRLTLDEINHYVGIPEDLTPRLLADMEASGALWQYEVIDNLGSHEVQFFVEPLPALDGMGY